jgi:hypothetical protein
MISFQAGVASAASADELMPKTTANARMDRVNTVASLRYDARARSDATAEMLILRSAAKWRARPGRHFASLTKASHAVDIRVKNALSFQENTPC